MPLMDVQNLFSDKQSIASTVGTVVGTNVIDLGAPGTDVQGNTVPHDLGGSAVEVEARVTTAVTSGGAATVQMQICTSDNADLSSPTVLQQTDAIGKATLVAGYRFMVGRIPPNTLKRYLGVQYVIAGATTTAGNVTAGIVLTATP